MHASILLALISILPLASCVPHARLVPHGAILPNLPAMPSSATVTGNATHLFDPENQGPTLVVPNPKGVPNPRFTRLVTTTTEPARRTTTSLVQDVTKSVKASPKPKNPLPPQDPPSSPGWVDCTANGGHCLVPGPPLPPTSTGQDLNVVHSGDATFFSPGLGACGRVNTDASIIVAVSHLLFDTFPGATSNPNLNPICGKTIRTMWGGKYTNVVVVDRCTGCGMWDLDYSPTAFARFGQPESRGRLSGMKWVFL